MKNMHNYYSLSRSECFNYKGILYSILCGGRHVSNNAKMNRIYIGKDEYTKTMNISIWFEI